MSIYRLLIIILILSTWIYHFSVYYHNDIAIRPIKKKYNICYYLRWIITILFLIWFFFPHNNLLNNKNKISFSENIKNNDILNEEDNFFENNETIEDEKSNNENEWWFTKKDNWDDPLKFPDNCEWWKVDRIIDWDTIVVNWERVRLIWIDTPETVDQNKPVECYWPEASERMKKLTLWRNICLIKDTISDDLDAHWRKLRYAYLENWKSVNETMLEESFSREYSKYDFWYKEKYKKIADKTKIQWKWIYECPIEENDNVTEKIDNNKEEKENNKDELTIIKEKIRNNEETLEDKQQIKEFIINETPIIETVKTDKINCNIKWNINNKWEKIYHLPWCASYNDTIITTSKWERWFCTESEAKAAWWRKAKNC